MLRIPSQNFKKNTASYLCFKQRAFPFITSEWLTQLPLFHVGLGTPRYRKLLAAALAAIPPTPPTNNTVPTISTSQIIVIAGTRPGSLLRFMTHSMYFHGRAQQQHNSCSSPAVLLVLVVFALGSIIWLQKTKATSSGLPHAELREA